MRAAAAIFRDDKVCYELDSTIANLIGSLFHVIGTIDIIEVSFEEV